jgi:hypothetical protein
MFRLIIVDIIRGMSHSLSLPLDGGECSASRPGRSTTGEIAPGTYCIGDWVSHGAGLDIAQ